MAWIKIDNSTPSKPEVLKIARILRIDKDAAFGKLVRLWCWFDQNSVDGICHGVTKDDIDILLNQEGFVDACITVGWIKMNKKKEYVELPRFDRHNGTTAKQRAETARRVALHRENSSNGSVTKNCYTRNSKKSLSQKQRLKILQRDDYTCVYCDRKKGEYAIGTETKRDGWMTIDHVIPESEGGSNFDVNLVTACIKCNQKKGNRSPDEAGMKWPCDVTGKRYGCNRKSVTNTLPEKRREELPPKSPKGGPLGVSNPEPWCPPGQEQWLKPWVYFGLDRWNALPSHLSIDQRRLMLEKEELDRIAKEKREAVEA